MRKDREKEFIESFVKRLIEKHGHVVEDDEDIEELDKPSDGFAKSEVSWMAKLSKTTTKQ